MKIELAGEEIELLPERAFYWPRKQLLGLSDVHLGKAESLQTYGIPIPAGSHHQDLATITRLIEKTQAREVCVLGDWIHQRNSWTDEIRKDLDVFFKKHSLIEWTLLLGNHERGSLNELAELPFRLVPGSQWIEPFLLTHGHHEDPTGAATSKATKNEEKSQKAFQIQGHVHPVIRIREGSIKMRLPCFVINQSSLTLPSFGILTGGYEIQTKKHQRVFAATPGVVFEVPS